jgi:hypothetical protein
MEMTNALKYLLSRNLKGRPLGRPMVEGRIILNCTFSKQDTRKISGFICLRIWSNCGLCVYNKERPSSMKGGEFFDQLFKDCALWSYEWLFGFGTRTDQMG